MRIAYLSGQYPRATDTFIQREVALLRQQGLEIHTFSVRRTGKEHLVGPEQQEEWKNTYYLLPPNLANLGLAHLQLLGRSPGRYLRSIGLALKTAQPGLRGLLYQLFYFIEAGILADQLKKRRIKHLHNHIASSSCTVAMLAAELGGFGFSFTMHGPHIFFEPYRWHLTEKLKRAQFVACIGHFCRSQGYYFAPISHWASLHIIHCGVEPRLYLPSTHTEERKRLLYVGRLSPEKGVPVLLESLRSVQETHPDVSLTIVGDGPARREWEQWVAQYGLSNQVDFVGYRSQQEVRQYLRETDVFVLPSFAEGVPVSLMEAMAASVPVVATQVAGVSELVEAGVSGYVVPPGSAEALTDALVQLLNSPEQRSRMGTAGRAKVEAEFNLEFEAEKLAQLFHSYAQA
ncbi:MAG: glycosyltransferase [Prochlorothrix sp.]|nr:glycosyltransferase [Prochlorothrix sp.]